MVIIYHCVAVHLSGISGASLQYFAGFFGLGNTYGSGGRRPCSVVQVKQNHLVAKTGEAGNGPTAAVFRIAGMAAGYDHLEFPARGLL
jgi:hypothetical protein